jgi:hypothetical protein
MNRSYYGEKTLRCQEIVGLEASNFGGKVLQIWMHLSQPFIIYGENAQGHIILIDVSCSGRVGTKVPSFLPTWAYGEEAGFHTKSDIIQIKKLLH